MFLMFNGNSCTLRMDTMQMAGVYSLAGDTLRMQFQNGSAQSWRCFMDGSALILDGSMRFKRQRQPGGQPPYGGQFSQQGQFPLEGVWVAQTPQGQLVSQLQGGRYVYYLNGQPYEQGSFVYYPDGRLQYQTTAGPPAGQRGVNRIVYQGQSFAMYGPNGSCITCQRQASQSQPGPCATPIEGRWIMVKSTPQISIGYVFSGNRFASFKNGVQKFTGFFQLTQTQLILQYDSGQTAALGCQLSDNRLVVFTSDDPNIDPIASMRQ